MSTYLFIWLSLSIYLESTYVSNLFTSPFLYPYLCILLSLTLSNNINIDIISGAGGVPLTPGASSPDLQPPRPDLLLLRRPARQPRARGEVRLQHGGRSFTVP